MTNELLQLGALAFIFLIAIREFFAWLKSRNNGNGNVKRIIGEVLEHSSENHLHEIPEIQRTLQRIEENQNRNFEKVVDALNRIENKL